LLNLSAVQIAFGSGFNLRKSAGKKGLGEKETWGKRDLGKSRLGDLKKEGLGQSQICGIF